MSKYSTINTEFDDQEALIESLRACGKQPVLAKDQVKGDQLEGYQGDKRADRAHVIIPRAQVGSASNDVGFFRNKDGKFRAIISEYDSSKYNQQWLARVRRGFVEAKQMASWKRAGYTEFEREEVNTDKGTKVVIRAKVPPQHQPAQQAQVGFRR